MAVSRRRITVLVVLVLALAGLATAGTWAAFRAAGWPTTSPAVTGPGMMNGRNGPGMMGGGWYALPGDGHRVRSLSAARQRAQEFADRLGLRAGEVIQFSNGFYAELLTTDGAGATEVLVDPRDGTVGVEPGPATMWNTAYGMHGGPHWAAGTTPANVSAEEAVSRAQRWLDRERRGLKVDTAQEFPGYYTLETMRDGKIAGMMSVHAITGAIWYHTWHGSFVDSSEE
jgi:hypothetical protein